MSMRRGGDASSVHRSGFWGIAIVLCALPLGVGCAPKAVVRFPEQLPVIQHAPSVNDRLLAEYAAWKGTPHRIGGTDRRGVDCSGFTRAIFWNAFRIALPRTSTEQSRIGVGVEPEDMKPGDLVYFVDKGGDHIGVVINSRQFLHASATLGVMLSSFDQYWTPRLLRVRRILSEG